jgi:hypothetical protein
MIKSIHSINSIVLNFLYCLPIVWFILGFIGFIVNTLTLLQFKLCSKTYFIYIFCNSIMDIIIVSFNLFLWILLILPDHISSSMFFVLSISAPLNFVLLPHISINFLLTAYIDIYASTCSSTSPLHCVRQMKMIPWVISLVLICSCGYLAVSYVPITFIYNPQNEKEFENLVRIWAIIYIITNGLIQPAIMLVIVLLAYRNKRNTHERVVSVSFTFELE